MSLNREIDPVHHVGDEVLYRFFDADDRLLYLGITNDPQVRFSRHRRKKPWWPLVARTERQVFATRTAVEIAEQEAIEREKPLHNTIYNRGRTNARQRIPAASAGCYQPMLPVPLMDACLTCFNAGYPLVGYGVELFTRDAVRVITIHRCARRHTWSRTRTVAA